MKIIGITGASGAGKETVVEYLKINKNFHHFSARDFITEEVKKKNLPVDRDTMRETANELRKLHSPSYIIESLYKQALEKEQDCVIESIRTPGEVDALRAIGHFHLLAVNADLAVRYQRILLRGSETDHISFDEFVEQNKKESSSTDPNNQNIDACISRADFVLDNNNSIDDLNAQIEKIFEAI